MSLSFLNNESGAVTVDWVVLTAAVTGMGLAVIGVVSPGLQDVANDIQTSLTQDTIIQASFGQLQYIPNDSGTFSLWRDTGMSWDSAQIQAELTSMGGDTGETFETSSSFAERDQYAGLQYALEAQGGTIPVGHADARNF